MGEEYRFPTPVTTHIRTIGAGDNHEMLLVGRLGAATLARHRARPRGQPAYTLLAEEPAGAAGSCLIAHERRGLGTATLDIAALTLEADRPAVAELLLATAVEVAAEAGFPLLTLHGEGRVFGAFGLAPCSLTSTVVIPACAPATPRLRSVTPDDADDLAALAAAASATLPLTARRAPSEWRWMLDAPAGWLALADERGRLVAYAHRTGDRATEAGAADAGTARELVAALAAEGVAALALPLGHAVARAALMLGGHTTTRAPRDDEAAELWGVVELSAALSALREELALRLASSHYAGWRGAVRLEGEAGTATLRCGDGAVAIVGAAGPVDVMVGGLGLSAAAQLLLGYRAAADLRATGSLRCADVDLGLIDALFPRL